MLYRSNNIILKCCVIDTDNLECCVNENKYLEQFQNRTIVKL